MNLWLLLTCQMKNQDQDNLFVPSVLGINSREDFSSDLLKRVQLQRQLNTTRTSILRSGRTREWGAEQTRRQWWFPRAPCSRCPNSAAADSWRCPRCTSAAGSRGSVSQTNSPACCQREVHKKSWINDCKCTFCSIKSEMLYLWEVWPMYPTKYFCLTTR